MSPRALRWILGLFPSESQTAAKVLGRDSSGYIGFMNPPASSVPQVVEPYVLTSNIQLDDQATKLVTALQAAVAANEVVLVNARILHDNSNSGNVAVVLDRPAGGTIMGRVWANATQTVVRNGANELRDASSAVPPGTYLTEIDVYLRAGGAGNITIGFIEDGPGTPMTILEGSSLTITRVSESA